MAARKAGEKVKAKAAAHTVSKREKLA